MPNSRNDSASADPTVLTALLPPLRASGMGNTVSAASLVRHLRSNIAQYEAILGVIRAEQANK